MSLFEAAFLNPLGYGDLRPAALPLPPQGFRLCDVREPAEFNGELGHIPGAVLVPLATLGAQARAWNKEEPVVLVCRSGVRSVQAALTLRSMGFSQVMNLTGGMLEWINAGRSVEK